MIKRLLAFVTDYCLISLLFGILEFYVFDLNALTIQSIGYFYVFFFFTMMGQYILLKRTLGEKIFKLQVQGKEGENVEVSTYVYRLFGTLICLTVPVLFLIVVFPKRRSLSDRMSSSNVKTRIV